MNDTDFDRLPDHIKNALVEANIRTMCTHTVINGDGGLMSTTEVFLEPGVYLHDYELKRLVQYNGFNKIVPDNGVNGAGLLKLVFWSVQ